MTVFLLLCGNCFLLIGITGAALFGIHLWRGERRVYLGERGFLSVRRRVEVAMRWETVREIRRQVSINEANSDRGQQVPWHTSSTILPVEGRSCSVTDEPALAIEEAVTAVLLPRAVEDYEAGKRLSFGWLALDSQGLSLTEDQTSQHDLPPLARFPGIARMLPKIRGTSVASGEQFLPWTELELCWIDESRGMLVISKKEERQHWAILPLYKVPNVTLCCRLVEHALSSRGFDSAYIEKEPGARTGQFLSLETMVQQETLLSETPVKTYRTAGTIEGQLFFWIMLSLLVFFTGALVVVLFQEGHDLFAFLSWNILLMMFFSVVALLFTFGFVFWKFRTDDTLVTPIRRKIVVSLYANGFLYVEGRQRQVVLWEHLRSVQRVKVKRGKRRASTYKVKMDDASEIHLKAIIQHIHALGEAVEQEIITCQFPRLQADYRANRPIVFPGLCVNQNWISKSEEKLRWHEVAQITFGPEHLIIKERGKTGNWLTAPLAQFPNICLLEALLISIKEEHGFGLDSI